MEEMGRMFQKQVASNKTMYSALKEAVFDPTLSSEEEEWFRISHSRYITFKKDKATQDILNHFYLHSTNPFQLALKFFVQNGTYENCKQKSFTYFGE